MVRPLKGPYKKKPGPKPKPKLPPSKQIAKDRANHGRTNKAIKEERFAEEYIISIDGASAITAAGIKVKNPADTASRMLAKPSVQAAVQRHMDERSERTGINADTVLYGIKEVIDRCLALTPIIDPETGESSGICKFDAANALRGYELLGKHLRLFADVKVHQGTVQHELIPVIDAQALATLTVEQLRVLRDAQRALQAGIAQAPTAPTLSDSDPIDGELID